MSRRTNRIAALESMVFLLCILTTVGVVSWLVLWSRYGFDFTDESFRLNWLAYPFLYDTSHIQVGYVLHPVYLLLGGDIVSLRIFNILLLFSAAYLCSFLLFTRSPEVLSDDGTENPGGLKLAALSGAMACGALLRFEDWLLVPGYSSISLVALLVFAASLFLVRKKVTRGSLAGWLLFAFSGWLAFVSKLSSAMLLAVVASVFLLAGRRMTLRGMVAGGAFLLLLLLVTALSIDGSIPDFIARVDRAIEFSRLMGSKRSLSGMFRLDEFDMRIWAVYEIAITTAYVCLATLLLLSERPGFRITGIILSLLLFVATWLVLSDQMVFDFRMTRLEEAKLFGIPLGLLSAMAISRVRYRHALADTRAFLLPAIMVVLPYIHAFGTNTNIWESSYKAGYFYIGAGIALFAYGLRWKPPLRVFLPAVAAVQLVTASVVAEEIRRPYRQPSLHYNEVEVSIGPGDSRLLLSADAARYIHELESILDGAGFTAGTPMIDMTGHSPGALYAVDALPIGDVWLVGGCKGCPDRAIASLRRVPCETRQAAWLLMEPGGPRALPESVLAAIGLHEDQYQVTGELLSPKGQGARQHRQIVLKPRSSAGNHIDCCDPGSGISDPGDGIPESGL